MLREMMRLTQTKSGEPAHIDPSIVVAVTQRDDATRVDGILKNWHASWFVTEPADEVATKVREAREAKEPADDHA